MSRILAIIIGCVPVVPPLQTQTEDGAAVAAVGSRFVKFMSEGDYRSAAEMISPHLSGSLDARSIEMLWAGETHDMGSFVRVIAPTAKSSGKQRWVDVEAEWERGRRSLRLIVGEDLKIVGMQWIPLNTPKPGMKPTPAKLGANILEDQVTIGTDPWSLPGTLTLPRSEKVQAAVVIVHDVGALDRDGSMGLNKPYRDLAVGLAEKKVASLRYDKRTLAHAGKFSGVATSVKDEVLDDALAAVTLLRQRPETAGAPIFVLGHGRGGTLAPYIAEADGKLAGIILLAAIARSNEEALLDQAEYIAGLYKDAEKSNEGLEKTHDQLNALRTRTLPPDEQFSGATASFWYDLCDRDADAAVRKAASLPCRILVLHPGRDYEATEEDYRLWKAGLAKHPDAAFQLLGDLNHLGAQGSGKATPQEKDVPKSVDQKLIDVIAGWCTKPASSLGTSTP